MSLWGKVFTAFKGKVNEAGEAITDRNAITILEQEIRESNEELRKSDIALTTIIGKRKVAQNKVKSTQKSIKEYENNARISHEKGNTELALECAKKVGELKQNLESESEYMNRYQTSETTLKQNVRTAKENMKRLEQQIDVVKANDAVQKAQEAVSSSYLGSQSKQKTASETLARIKNRQETRQAEIEAAAELSAENSGDELEQKLKEAGITSGGSSSADDELARILGK